MYTSSSIAKKYGLERYLEQPSELNETIFSMLLLQETIQTEKARKKKKEAPGEQPISVKRAAYGKFVARCSGNEQYRYAVETALKASTDTIAIFQRKRFVNLLRNMGVPDEAIAEFCDTITIDDDTHCVDQE